MTAKQLIALSTGVFAFAVVTSSCSAPKQAVAPAPPPAQQLWGDMKPIVSVKELMRDMIDPASDYVFDAIGSVSNKKGTVETSPKTDADWDKIRWGGVMLAEGAYLLKVPRPFAPPGDENNSTGPDPEELSPAQIKAKLERDPVLWNAKIEALRNVGLQVLDIVKRKEHEGVVGRLRQPRSGVRSLPSRVLVPDERAFLQKLTKQLDELYGLKALHPTAPAPSGWNRRSSGAAGDCLSSPKSNPSAACCAPAMKGARFVSVLLRRADLRTPFPPRFARATEGADRARLDRRAKYLLAALSSGETLLMHLGMSGTFRVERAVHTVGARSRDLPLSSGCIVTFNDPRRFGLMDLLTPRQLAAHATLSRLGPEPLSAAFDAAALARACRGKQTSIKVALLDQRVVAGLGNIYVVEALHLARLSPLRRASTIATPSGAPRPSSVPAGRRDQAGAGGGDRARVDGRIAVGRFRVYDRAGERCRTPRCTGSIAQRTQAGRTTFYCPVCQR